MISSSNAAVNGKTYAQVIQDTVDMFANGQSNVNSAAAAGNPGYRGGWRYMPATGQSDGAKAQWPAIGMLFAEQVRGITVPQFVKGESTYWIDYIQCCSNGGSGYDVPCGGSVPVSESKTGGLLVEMAFTGYSGSASGAGDLSNKAAAQIKDDPNEQWNWCEDYSQYLANTQSGDGSSPGYYYWPQDLATAWNVNILDATQIGPGPDPNPNPEPATLSLLGLALAGLAAGWRRKTI